MEEIGGIRLSDYCDNFGRLTRERLERDDTGRAYLAMLESDGKTQKDGFLISAHYAAVLDDTRFPAHPWGSSLRTLRYIEMELRNPVTHTITRVDEDWLKKELRKLKESAKAKRMQGVERIQDIERSQDILNLLKEAVRAVNQDAKAVGVREVRLRWESYDEMNRGILNSMG